MNENVQNLTNESYEVMYCEQSWHMHLDTKVMFKVPAVNYAGCLNAKDKLEKFVSVYGYDVAFGFVLAEFPIAARRELMKLAGGKLCTHSTLKNAIQTMLTWNGTPSSSTTTAQTRVELSKIKGELAVAQMREVQQAREFAYELLSMVDEQTTLAKLQKIYPKLDAKAIVSAVKIDIEKEAEVETEEEIEE